MPILRSQRGARTPHHCQPIRVGDTVELELVEDEAPDETFWAPARVASVDSRSAFAAKIHAPGSAWHAWVEAGYLFEAEGVEWRRVAPRVLHFTHDLDPRHAHSGMLARSSTLGRVQASARRQRSRATESTTRPPEAKPLLKVVKQPMLSKHQGRVVKLRLHVAGSRVRATVSPRRVPRSWTAAEDASLVKVLRDLVQRRMGSGEPSNLWLEAITQLASGTGMPERSVNAVAQRWAIIRARTQQLVHAAVSVTAGRVALTLQPCVSLPVLPQSKYSVAQEVRQLRSELNTSKSALGQAQTDLESARAQIEELHADVERLSAEITRLHVDNTALLATQNDAVAAAHDVACPAVKKRREGDVAQGQGLEEARAETTEEVAKATSSKRKLSPAPDRPSRKRPLPAKEAHPARRPPMPAAIPLPVSNAAPSPPPRPNQRVHV